MNQFINGAILMASLVAALFFVRFFVATRDRLFAAFAIAFTLLAFERVLLVPIEPEGEARTFVFLIRLVAFIVLVVAIVDKNRATRPPSAGRRALERLRSRRPARPERNTSKLA